MDRRLCCRCRSGGLVTVEVRRLLVSDYDAFDNQFDGLACYQTQESRFAGMRLHDNLAAGISLDLEFDHNFFASVASPVKMVRLVYRFPDKTAGERESGAVARALHDLPAHRPRALKAKHRGARKASSALAQTQALSAHLKTFVSHPNRAQL